eukprot:3344623-Rhodomonas_salina.1
MPPPHPLPCLLPFSSFSLAHPLSSLVCAPYHVLYYSITGLSYHATPPIRTVLYSLSPMSLSYDATFCSATSSTD